MMLPKEYQALTQDEVREELENLNSALEKFDFNIAHMFIRFPGSDFVKQYNGLQECLIGSINPDNTEPPSIEDIEKEAKETTEKTVEEVRKEAEEKGGKIPSSTLEKLKAELFEQKVNAAIENAAQNMKNIRAIKRKVAQCLDSLSNGDKGALDQARELLYKKDEYLKRLDQQGKNELENTIPRSINFPDLGNQTNEHLKALSDFFGVLSKMDGGKLQEKHTLGYLLPNFLTSPCLEQKINYQRDTDKKSKVPLALKAILCLAADAEIEYRDQNPVQRILAHERDKNKKIIFRDTKGVIIPYQEDADGKITFLDDNKNPILCAKVNAETGDVTFFDLKGAVITREKDFWTGKYEFQDEKGDVVENLKNFDIVLPSDKPFGYSRGHKYDFDEIKKRIKERIQRLTKADLDQKMKSPDLDARFTSLMKSMGTIIRNGDITSAQNYLEVKNAALDKLPQLGYELPQELQPSSSNNGNEEEGAPGESELKNDLLQKAIENENKANSVHDIEIKQEAYHVENTTSNQEKENTGSQQMTEVNQKGNIQAEQSSRKSKKVERASDPFPTTKDGLKKLGLKPKKFFKDGKFSRDEEDRFRACLQAFWNFDSKDSKGRSWDEVSDELKEYLDFPNRFARKLKHMAAGRAWRAYDNQPFLKFYYCMRAKMDPKLAKEGGTELDTALKSLEPQLLDYLGLSNLSKGIESELKQDNSFAKPGQSENDNSEMSTELKAFLDEVEQIQVPSLGISQIDGFENLASEPGQEIAFGKTMIGMEENGNRYKEILLDPATAALKINADEEENVSERPRNVEKKNNSLSQTTLFTESGEMVQRASDPTSFVTELFNQREKRSLNPSSNLLSQPKKISITEDEMKKINTSKEMAVVKKAFEDEKSRVKYGNEVLKQFF